MDNIATAKDFHYKWWWHETQREPNNVNVLLDEKCGYFFNTCKKGNMSFARAMFYRYPYTRVYYCELCGKAGDGKRIQSRYVYGWEYIKKEEGNSITILCCGCWNKTKAIKNKHREALEIKRLSNKLLKEIRNGRKNQNNGRPEKIPVQVD